MSMELLINVVGLAFLVAGGLGKNIPGTESGYIGLAILVANWLF